jgi:hypothetical protein
VSGPSELNEAAAAEQMALYGITRVPADQYRYKEYRYSKLSDAIAQAKRNKRPLDWT